MDLRSCRVSSRLSLLAGCLLVLLASIAQPCRSDEDRTWKMGPKTRKAMLDVLSSENLPGRMKAAMALGMVRAKGGAVTKALSALLRSDYAPARVSALYALGRSRDKNALLPILKALKDSDEEVRIEACRALAELGAASKVKMLPFDDKNSRVRLAAFHAAARLKSADVISLLEKRYFAEKEPDVRAAIFAVLMAMDGMHALKATEKALEDKEPVVRAAALQYLAQNGSTKQAGLGASCRLLLKDKAAIVRRAAVAALVRVVGDKGEAAVAALSKDEDHTVRRAVAEALGDVGTRHVRTTLQALQTDAVRPVRRAASDALVRHAARTPADRGAIEQIAVGCLSAEDESVKREGIWMLGQMKSTAGFQQVLQLAEKTFDAPAKKGKGEDTPGPDYRTSRLVAWLVAETAHEPAGDLMMTYFTNPADSVLRIHAARALGNMKYQKAASLIAQTIMKTRTEMGTTFFVYSGYERHLGIWALGEIGGQTAMNALATIAASIKPPDSIDNIQSACEILVRNKYTAAATRMKSAIANRKFCMPEHQNILADAIKALGESRPQTEPVVRVNQYDRFFLNVKE